MTKRPRLGTTFAWLKFFVLGFLLSLGLGRAAQAGTVPSSAEAIPGGMFRFWPQGADRSLPSFALKDSFIQGEPLTATPGLRPEFVRHFFGGISVHVPVPKDWDLYGTGEVAGGLRRNGALTEVWNTDSYHYTAGAKQLYEAHPWVLAVAKDGSAVGILADSTWRMNIDLSEGVTFDSSGPPFPVYILPGATPQEVMRKLALLTGSIPLPPKWALGYHQCRYSYFPDSRVREIAAEFRARRIPADVIWLDINYMDKYKIFTFDPQSFPDPTKLNADLHAEGFHTIWMIDPGVGAQPGYSVYDQGTKMDAWVKTAAGAAYQGKVWPGPCVFPDFTRTDVRDWWASLYGPFLAHGIDGVWNDMNEPCVFVKDKTMPLDNRFGGYGGGPHARFHNVYGMLMVKATRQGIQQARPDKRPFVLSRANFIGGQRYAAAWTGDNTADWTHLGLSVPMVLNLGLSGQPFAGPDIGGFIGNGTPKLFARWMGIGTLLPFCRAHADRHDTNKEPWAFGAATEDTCRRAIERRYRLMPYLYTVFEQAASTGLPVARPLFFADPTDASLRSEDSSFLLGGDLLVQTQPFEDHTVEHPLPKGDWKLLSFESMTDPDLPVLRLRPGALLPTGPVVQNTGVKVSKLTLYVNLDRKGHAEGWLYEDAGDGYGYEKGDYSLRKLAVQETKGRPVVTVESKEGTFKGVTQWTVVEL
ncbi:MAG TPA: TIM-barrel domain-containing protein [bacterium]|jgi:alpha-glucosidase|nr:TIM-barrel domain-containing protein [bacterium]